MAARKFCTNRTCGRWLEEISVMKRRGRMFDFQNRYELDESKRMKLVGLTFEETMEFEKLDHIPPPPEVMLDDWMTRIAANGLEARWVELFGRHLKALVSRNQKFPFQ